MAAALVEKEAHFRLLAEGSSDMVTRIGLDERIRYVSLLHPRRRLANQSVDRHAGACGRRPRGPAARPRNRCRHEARREGGGTGHLPERASGKTQDLAGIDHAGDAQG
jgi:hypothetical protein